MRVSQRFAIGPQIARFSVNSPSSSPKVTQNCEELTHVLLSHCRGQGFDSPQLHQPKSGWNPPERAPRGSFKRQSDGQIPGPGYQQRARASGARCPGPDGWDAIAAAWGRALQSDLFPSGERCRFENVAVQHARCSGLGKPLRRENLSSGERCGSEQVAFFVSQERRLRGGGDSHQQLFSTRHSSKVCVLQTPCRREQPKADALTAN